mmetsp:Transcript_2696/g.3683  ORF Transcript_2696/g.3683 Transcript_2696/m.3683 type:complete len:226 (+) Transcript_2696:3194-3871(+)
MTARTIRRTHGQAEQARAASAPPVPKTARWRLMLNSVLETLPAEPELDSIFFERRRANLWRRQRRAVCNSLNASWSGFLWRKSTAWRKHFATIQNNKLCFWFQPRHALNGVTPVLVLDIGASILLPVNEAKFELLTIHAAKAGSDKFFEWHFMTASRADAQKLRKLITAGSTNKKRSPRASSFVASTPLENIEAAPPHTPPRDNRQGDSSKENFIEDEADDRTVV